MAQEVRLPKLSPSMQEGIVVEWLVREGDTVEAGQPLVQIESDKAVLDVESPTGGRLVRVAQPKGSRVPVGEVLALIE
ncbi:MAG: biotin/lipoyl-binding protein [Chloroflexi bacterium]|nr:biotin/lipoyl-binding protein [Chloroflexota bacterium]